MPLPSEGRFDEDTMAGNENVWVVLTAGDVAVSGRGAGGWRGNGNDGRGASDDGVVCGERRNGVAGARRGERPFALADDGESVEDATGEDGWEAARLRDAIRLRNDVTRSWALVSSSLASLTSEGPSSRRARKLSSDS